MVGTMKFYQVSHKKMVKAQKFPPRIEVGILITLLLLLPVFHGGDALGHLAESFKNCLETRFIANRIVSTLMLHFVIAEICGIDVLIAPFFTVNQAIRKGGCKGISGLGGLGGNGVVTHFSRASNVSSVFPCAMR